MQRPTGDAWRHWKTAMRRKGHSPKDWVAFWHQQQKGKPATENDGLEERVRLLDLECKRLKSLAVSHAMVRTEIVKLAAAKPDVPRWLVNPGKVSKHSPGVPTLLASDWHWGEIIKPEQIGGVNAYGLEIAHKRAKRLIEATIDLLNNHMVNPQYPGIVFALGGDMVSGDIHEELSRTNEAPIMPVVLDLLGVLAWCIRTLADAFGAVFVPCVSGNHSRITMKPFAKDRNHLSFDWLIYQLLEKQFEGDRRVSFLIPEGPDAHYRVFNHRYLLTHGDQFRGGDGMIGALGPIIRGGHKKQSRNTAINQAFDTMLLGHWHQYLPLGRVIVNGSLCGYNEYANRENFAFEAPRQALWLTHSKRGITFHMPVSVDEEPKAQAEEWVSVRKGAA